ALGTVVLAAVTLVLVGVTAWMARAASNAAKDSARAATSAEAAALAAKRSNELQVAQLPIDFKVMYASEPIDEPDGGKLLLTCKASTVYVHGLAVMSVVGTTAGSGVIHDHEEQPCTLAPSVKAEAPYLLHRNESLLFSYPGDQLVWAEDGGKPMLRVRVTYRVTPNTEKRSIDRQVTDFLDMSRLG
ncbi:MAG: hypothetical protein JWM93_1807, partial [Frankiales bacterium]|nr:hypothetical protein [Frankiales bacterium]